MKKIKINAIVCGLLIEVILCSALYTLDMFLRIRILSLVINVFLCRIVQFLAYFVTSRLTPHYKFLHGFAVFAIVTIVSFSVYGLIFYKIEGSTTVSEMIWSWGMLLGSSLTMFIIWGAVHVDRALIKKKDNNEEQ